MEITKIQVTSHCYIIETDDGQYIEIITDEELKDFKSKVISVKVLTEWK